MKKKFQMTLCLISLLSLPTFAKEPALVIVGKKVIERPDSGKEYPPGSLIVVGKPQKAAQKPANYPKNPNDLADCSRAGYRNCKAALMFQNMILADQFDRAGRITPWILQLLAMTSVISIDVNTSSNPQLQTASTRSIKYPILLELGNFRDIKGQLGDRRPMDSPEANAGQVDLHLAIETLSPAPGGATLETIAASLSGSIGQDGFIIQIIPSCADDVAACNSTNLTLRTTGGLIRHSGLENYLPKVIRQSVDRNLRSASGLAFDEISVSQGGITFVRSAIRIDSKYNAYDYQDRVLWGFADIVANSMVAKKDPNLVISRKSEKNSYQGYYIAPGVSGK